MNISDKAYIKWKEKIDENTSLGQIEKIFNPLWFESNKMDGDYITVIKDKCVKAIIKDKSIIDFVVNKDIKLIVTYHFCNRWRDRVNKNDSNDDINDIFGKLDLNEFDPSIGGKYIISYKEKNIIVVITELTLITVIVDDKIVKKNLN